MTTLLTNPGKNTPLSRNTAPRMLVAQILVNVPELMLDSSINLLLILSRVLTVTMSETEFNSLLSHAAHRADIDCPEWRPKLRSEGGELEFGKLRNCLAGHEEDDVVATLDRLWDALVEQLILLIGEHLTLLQLRRAVSPS